MKRMIVCCDGTWNSADQHEDDELCPTNVLQTAVRVATRDNTVSQLVYYDEGVGTGNALDRFTGGAFGTGLLDNVLAAYRFLALNYEPGDELYFFGFSRGAFTVRSLVGMVRKCGILKRTSTRNYLAAIATYCNEQSPREPGPTEFRKNHCLTAGSEIPVKFLGVWDTVGALGIPLRGLRWLTRRKHQFHDVELSGSVKNAFHALAIDERRAPFEAARWKPMLKEGQVVQQLWFCGAHSDVGGGYRSRRLSDISLLWMLDRAASLGLALDDGLAADDRYKIKPDPLAPITNSKAGLYALTPGIDRIVGLAASDRAQPSSGQEPEDPTQVLHPSVMHRWDNDSTYRPKSLCDYFARVGNPRAQQ
jgi:uncharacterized protein (DUF2235 family)